MVVKMDSYTEKTEERDDDEEMCACVFSFRAGIKSSSTCTHAKTVLVSMPKPNTQMKNACHVHAMPCLFVLLYLFMPNATVKMFLF